MSMRKGGACQDFSQPKETTLIKALWEKPDKPLAPVLTRQLETILNPSTSGRLHPERGLAADLLRVGLEMSASATVQTQPRIDELLPHGFSLPQEKFQKKEFLMAIAFA